MLISAPVITRYVSDSGTDTDGCGQTDETACQTMRPVLTELSAQQTLVPAEIIARIDKVWKKFIDLSIRKYHFDEHSKKFEFLP